MNQNNKQKNIYDGSVLFDGKIEIAVNGVKKQLRIDYLGGRLHEVDPEREVIIMRKGNVEYQELDTGFVFFTDEMRENLTFGLKPQADSKSYSVYSASDVIAWGYADEGDDSCPVRLTDEDRKKLKDLHRSSIYRKYKRELRDLNLCLQFQDKNGEIGIRVETPKEQLGAYLVAAADYMLPCMTNYFEFTKRNPEIKEVHYFTKATEWEE